MEQWIISNIVPILATALFGVLTAIAKGIGNVIIAYFSRKEKALIAKIGADTYNTDLAKARSVWGMVDEDARTNPELQKLAGDVTARIQAKQKLFAEKIQKAIPGITDDEIEQLRQAVAGEVNKGREALTVPVTAGVVATTPDSAPVVGTVDTSAPAVNGAETGTVQAAAVKTDTALSGQPESGAVTSDTTGAV